MHNVHIAVGTQLQSLGHTHTHTHTHTWRHCANWRSKCFLTCWRDCRSPDRIPSRRWKPIGACSIRGRRPTFRRLKQHKIEKHVVNLTLGSLASSRRGGGALATSSNFLCLMITTDCIVIQPTTYCWMESTARSLHWATY